MNKVPRVAVTIIYNGLHHLKHKGFVDFMLKNFDYWAIAEGHSRNGGSTWFCKNIKVPPTSTDGTIEFLKELAENNPKVLFHTHGKYYRSKDDQANKCVSMLKAKLNFAFLWQVDVDEHWKLEDMILAENTLLKSGKRQARVNFNHFVGKDLVAVGDWGDEPMARLFIWRGQKFIHHEPPSMHPLSRTINIPVKFDHYSYYFPVDVKFKEQYYGECEGLYDRWSKLQECKEFPQPITTLFPENTYIGRSNSKIIKYEN